jgi:tetratricopeptide (TPR) repeat protein
MKVHARIYMSPSAWLRSLICGLAVTLASAPAIGAFQHFNEGMVVPEIKGTAIITNESVSLTEMRKNRMVIVLFWATWSPRSVQELTEFEALVQQYGRESIDVLAVNVDGSQISDAKRTAIQKLVTENQLSFPVVIDEGLESFDRYGVIAVPSTAVVDSNGVLRYGPSGYSLRVRDVIFDSIETYLGLREAPETTMIQGYRPEKKASRYYELALNLYMKGLFDRADPNLGLAVEADSQFAAPHSLKARILLDRGEHEAAAGEFETATVLDPKSVAAWSGWGHALLRAGQDDLAIEKLSQALALDDAYTPALLDLGLALAQQGRADEGLDSLGKASELNPRDALAHYYIGKVNRIKSDNAAALQAYLAALEIYYPEPLGDAAE